MLCSIPSCHHKCWANLFLSYAITLLDHQDDDWVQQSATYTDSRKNLGYFKKKKFRFLKRPSFKSVSINILFCFKSTLNCPNNINMLRTPHHKKHYQILSVSKHEIFQKKKKKQFTPSRQLDPSYIVEL